MIRVTDRSASTLANLRSTLRAGKTGGTKRVGIKEGQKLHFAAQLLANQYLRQRLSELGSLQKSWSSQVFGQDLQISGQDLLNSGSLHLYPFDSAAAHSCI